ncbi:unnamed protein product [Discosporangium mesarthrocarpum]
MASCGVSEAREILELARERITASGGSGGSGGSETGVGEREGGASWAQGGVGGAGGSGESGSGGGGREGPAEGIRALIRVTWEEVKAWCDEEAQARIRRKDTQVRERLRAVEKHREALVATLRDSGVAGISASNREFGERFRPMAGEVVLCDCQAAHAKRVGRLYLTYYHLCFHSSMLGFTSQRVLPMFTSRSVSRSASALGVETLTVVDSGGVPHAFTMTSVDASGFGQRFHDLAQQVLGMFKVGRGLRAWQEEEEEEEGETDEMQILARIQRQTRGRHSWVMMQPSSGSGSGSGLTPPSPHSAPPLISSVRGGRDEGTGRGVGEGAGVEVDVGVGAGAVVGGRGLTIDSGMGYGSLPGGRPGAMAGAGAGAGAGVTSGRPVPRSSMAMGIQAFLEQSQRKS